MRADENHYIQICRPPSEILKLYDVLAFSVHRDVLFWAKTKSVVDGTRMGERVYRKENV